MEPVGLMGYIFSASAGANTRRSWTCFRPSCKRANMAHHRVNFRQLQGRSPVTVVLCEPISPVMLVQSPRKVFLPRMLSTDFGTSCFANEILTEMHRSITIQSVDATVAEWDVACKWIVALRFPGLADAQSILLNCAEFRKECPWELINCGAYYFPDSLAS